MFNSRQYEWADITLILGGRDLVTLRKISYSEKIEKEAVYGKGKYPIAIQSGNYGIEGEVGILQSDLETLVAASPSKSLLGLSLDAIVQYGNPANGDTPTSDRILGLQFTEVPKELNQGDKFMEVNLPFLALRVVNQSL